MGGSEDLLQPQHIRNRQPSSGDDDEDDDDGEDDDGDNDGDDDGDDDEDDDDGDKRYHGSTEGICKKEGRWKEEYRKVKAAPQSKLHYC